MDINIDCESINIVACTASEVSVELSNVDANQLSRIVSDMDADEVISAFDDDTDLIEHLDLGDICNTLDQDDLLNQIGISVVKYHFDLIEEDDAPDKTLDDFSVWEIANHVDHGDLLAHMSVNDVIAYFGEDAFSHLHPTQTKIKL